jgi:hypothetical protein
MSDISYKLSDATIAQVAKLLQVAILSGTDIVDNLRTLRLVDNNGVLDLDEAYKKRFSDGLDAMMAEVENVKEEEPIH